MGAQWKAKGKALVADAKGKLFGKLVKEIMVAARLGGGDPAANSRLRMAVEAARKASMPKDTLDRAIKKGSGAGADAVNSSPRRPIWTWSARLCPPKASKCCRPSWATRPRIL